MFRVVFEMHERSNEKNTQIDTQRDDTIQYGTVYLGPTCAQKLTGGWLSNARNQSKTESNTERNGQLNVRKCFS